MFFLPNPRLPRGLNDQSGFTLIEMLVVVAIAAVLTAFALGDLQNSVHRTKTKAAVRRLRVDLQKAKLEAVKQNTNCLVEFTIAAGTDAGSCVTCISTDNDCADPGDEIISRLNFNDYSNVVLQSASFTGSPLFVFNSRGMPETTGGGFAAGRADIVCTSDAGYSFILWMARTGRIRIE